MSEHLDRAVLERFDAMDAVEREPVLRHAATCTACRRSLIEDDPTRLFSLIGVSAVPAETLERLSGRVAREIDRENERARARRRRYDRAALAASLVLGLAIGSYLWTRPTVEAWRAEDAAPRRLAVQPAEREFPGGAFEILSSPGEAQVLDLSVGDTQIVMIFDEELEI